MKYTLFTPTYNRASLLPVLFESMDRQTMKDFEWLIIDDGSSDNTESVVVELSKKSSFPIRYVKKSNGGKHTAYNLAIELADSEWFVCIDSDDPLTPDALENMEKAAAIVRDDAAGFVGICVTPQGKLVETKIKNPFYSDTIEIRDVFHIQAEPEVYRLNLLKKYRFPVFEDEKFITEAIVFDTMTQGHKLLYTNFPMQVKEYLAGGLTDNQTKIRIESPNGTLAYYKQRYKLSRKYIYKLKALVNYCRFMIHARKGGDNISSPTFRLAYLVFPISYLLYMRDRCLGN